MENDDKVIYSSQFMMSDLVSEASYMNVNATFTDEQCEDLAERISDAVQAAIEDFIADFDV